MIDLAFDGVHQRLNDGTADGNELFMTDSLQDPAVPIANNWIENRIRPVVVGRSNWLFAGSLRGEQRAATAMSLIQSARLNGHDQYAYLRDVLERLPTQPNSRIDELLDAHRVPSGNG